MIVYTVGTFDLLHVGHLALLEYCETLGDIVAVGVASDSVVRSYKPNTPVIPLEQRMEMLKALKCVDVVHPYYHLNYIPGCLEVKPDIFVIGEDWGSKAHNIDVEAYLCKEGKKLIQIKYSPRSSSSEIKRNVIEQDRSEAIVAR